jgi:hypothetical protein
MQVSDSPICTDHPLAINPPVRSKLSIPKKEDLPTASELPLPHLQVSEHYLDYPSHLAWSRHSDQVGEDADSFVAAHFPGKFV